MYAVLRRCVECTSVTGFGQGVTFLDPYNDSAYVFYGIFLGNVLIGRIYFLMENRRLIYKLSIFIRKYNCGDARSSEAGMDYYRSSPNISICGLLLECSH